MTMPRFSKATVTALALVCAATAAWGVRQPFSQSAGAAAESDPSAARTVRTTVAAADAAGGTVRAAAAAAGDAAPQWDVTVTSEDSNYEPVPRSQKDRAMRARLEEPVELQYIDIPLAEIVEDLSRRLAIHTEIDRRALEDIGVDASAAVNANYRGISLRSALDLMLDPLELTYLIEEDYLQITTVDEAEQRLDTRVYPIRLKWNANSAELAKAVVTIVHPVTWDVQGGPGSIAPLGNNLIASQTDKVHAEITHLLQQIDTAARLENGQ